MKAKNFNFWSVKKTIPAGASVQEFEIEFKMMSQAGGILILSVLSGSGLDYDRLLYMKPELVFNDESVKIISDDEYSPADLIDFEIEVDGDKLDGLTDTE